MKDLCKHMKAEWALISKPSLPETWKGTLRVMALTLGCVLAISGLDTVCQSVVKLFIA